MKHTNETVTRLRAIPADRWQAKVAATFWGLAIAAAAIVAVWLWQAPYWVAIAGVGVAGVVASGEIVLAPFRLLLALVLDARDRWRRAP